MGKIFIGLGSNLGDRAQWLATAIAALQENPQLRLVKRSAIYESEPVGMREQPAFLNQVIEIGSELLPLQLLDCLLQFEAQLGRQRLVRWGPRNIDLDLLACDQVRMHTRRLTLPHPQIAHRRFVLLPWVEIAPDFVMPGTDRTVAALLASCRDQSKVVRLPN